MKKKIAIITPVLNEEDSIRIYLERVSDIIYKKNNYDFNILFINNCSTDKTLEKIIELKKNYTFQINIITFTRNFGYQASLMCGLKKLNADAYFILDADLEDPPEMLNTFIKFWEEGYKHVYGIRNVREGNILINILRNIFYKIMSGVADFNFIPFMAEFSLIDLELRNYLIKNNTAYPLIRENIGYANLKKRGCQYIRQQRKFGKSNYNFFGILQYAITAFLSSSTFLLRINSYLTVIFFIFNFIALFLYYTKIIDINLQVLILINFNIILFLMGGFSLYLARLYKQSLKKPLYIIDKTKTYLI